MRTLGPAEDLQSRLVSWFNRYLETGTVSSDELRLSSMQDSCNDMVEYTRDALEKLFEDSLDYGFKIKSDFKEQLELLLPRLFFCSEKEMELLSVEDLELLEDLGERIDAMAENDAEYDQPPDPDEVCEILLNLIELATRAVAFTEFLVRERKLREAYFDRLREESSVKDSE